MRILQFGVENFKKVRFAEVTPKNRLVQITGRNGQGKTSLLDALWVLLVGKKLIPDKPVRKGAEKSKLTATIGDENNKPYLIVKRTIAGDRTQTLTVEAAPGATRPLGTPQAVLDALMGNMGVDPLAFIQMEPADQVQQLRGLVKLDIDIEALNKENNEDFEQRKIVNREVKRLETEAADITVQDKLPKEKVDAEAILTKIRGVDAINAEQRQIDEARNEARKAREILIQAVDRKFQTTNDLATELTEAEARAQRLKKEAEEHIQGLKSKMATESQALLEAEATLKAADLSFEKLPIGKPVEVTALTQELQEAQTINREIDNRDRRNKLEEQLRIAQKQSSDYTRAMEFREEQKAEAMAKAAMPLDGLTFTEEGVWFKGIPLTQLGEAEQLRIGCALSMAANPKLRALPIYRGECLDDQSLALLEKLAEENDFQVFMARVESSGTVGIVLSDGMVESDNQ